MEAVVKKYQQKFKKARDEMDRWDQLQSRLLSQFRNASAVIEALEVLQDTKNYGVLKSIAGIKEQMIGKQMMSLDTIIGSMKDTLKEFHAIVLSLERNIRDGRQLVKGGSKPLSQNQMQLGIGIQPSIADCLEGLRLIHEMYHHEYNLKLSIVSELMSIKRSASELGSLQQFLADQPNIPKEEGAVFVVCLLITCSLWSSAIILLVLVMIVVDLMGAMAILDIQLNAVSVVNLVMAIGIAVEFCVHITHTFSVSSGDRGQLAKEALSTMGASVFSGITLTKLVGVIVLRFSRSEVFVVYYFQMYLALVLIGFLYGLVFLPVVLSICGSPSRSTLTERNQEDEMSSASSSESQSRTAY